MIVYAVVRWHNPTVSHGSELVAVFSTREKAQAYADKWNEYYGVSDGRQSYRHGCDDEHEVEEWTVDEYAPSGIGDNEGTP